MTYRSFRYRLLRALAITSCSFVFAAPSCAMSDYGASNQAPNACRHRRLDVVRTYRFRAESSFDEVERRAILRAARIVERETCGLIALDVTFDLVISRDVNDVVRAKYGIIVPIDSADIDVILGDKADPEGTLLGYTITHDMLRPARAWVTLVRDRLDDDEDFIVRVTMHELGHAIGLQHVDDPFANMASQASEYNRDLAWGDADREEFCRVWSCEPEWLVTCRSDDAT